MSGPQQRIPAVYMRGGTSRCLVFHGRDLPAQRQERDRIFLAALGSPDPHGRQLNGLGGGLSSLSKVCVVEPASRPDADVDFTFAQVPVRGTDVDYRSGCGNCTAAVAAFAIDEGLVERPDGDATVAIHITNTSSITVARLAVQSGQAVVDGDYELSGVSGTGAPIELEFRDPGGATTGKLLPTGSATDALDGTTVSLVDAAMPVVFVRAEDVGLTATESPDAIDADRELLLRLETLRSTGGRAMGLAESENVPKVCAVAPPVDFTASDGTAYSARDADLAARALSMGNCHRALPLTAALCLAVAARIPGSVVHEAIGADRPTVRVGHPGGVLALAASAESVTVVRTARRLMEGFVLVSAQ
jgi:2-methylaconitate isomerase